LFWQVIADFDMTLTKYLVNGVRGQSKFILKCNNLSITGELSKELCVDAYIFSPIHLTECTILQEINSVMSFVGWGFFQQCTWSWYADGLIPCILSTVQTMQARMLFWRAIPSMTWSDRSFLSIIIPWKFLHPYLLMRKPSTWKNGTSNEKTGFFRACVWLFDSECWQSSLGADWCRIE